MSIWTAYIGIFVKILLYIYDLIGQNFGWAIIVFTIISKIITIPITSQQMKSSRGMQELQNSKEYKDIERKYKNDKEMLNRKRAEYMAEKGINPASSCLPLIAQLLIGIGLYRSLFITLAVTPTKLVNLARHISGSVNLTKLIPINSQFWWMDLSMPERLPVMGIRIPLLAILAAITTYASSKLIAPSQDPSDQASQAAQMTQSMTLTMPLFMGFLALSLNAGIALYLVLSNLATIVQYIILGQANFKNLIPSLPTRSA
jgi:YidC/Oxa1 family membrane protein insertase